jgi:hypothetical protein
MIVSQVKNRPILVFSVLIAASGCTTVLIICGGGEFFRNTKPALAH